MALSIFTPSVTGMDVQSQAMTSVSTNMANMRTVGYKSNETLFYSLLGSNPVVKGNSAWGLSSTRVDIDGVGAYDRTNIGRQGIIATTGNYFDAALNQSNAFFTLKDAGGDLYYTRAGSFSTVTQNGQTFLIGNNGFKVQGFPAAEGGGFSSSLSDIELKYIEKIPSKPTSVAEVIANVPADGVDSSSYGITVYGPNNDGRPMTMTFRKVEGKANTWDVSFALEDGTVTGGGEVLFSPNGEVVSPKNMNLAVTWNDGSTNSIDLDISNMTQYAGSTGITKVSQDGRESGNFVRALIDDYGVVKAQYSNGETLNYAKLAIVGFTSPENLTPVNGTLFEANSDTGSSYYVIGADTVNSSVVVPESVESSNVNVEQEFSNLIVIQRAYSLNSSAFTTANEMTSVAIDLKS
ncbi:MAG: flagellar hook-basal body complex protein [Alphaproteobacteria bacterium]